MNVQYIHDHQGNATGVFIPIKEWQALKKKYNDLQREETESNTAPNWHEEVVIERLEELSTKMTGDFEQLLKNKRHELG